MAAEERDLGGSEGCISLHREWIPIQTESAASWRGSVCRRMTWNCDVSRGVGELPAGDE